MFDDVDKISLLLLVTKLSVLSITKYLQRFSWKYGWTLFLQHPILTFITSSKNISPENPM